MPEEAGAAHVDETAGGQRGAFYLFCFARADRCPDDPCPRIDEVALCFHREQDLLGVLTPVPCAMFAGEDAARHFSDPLWVASQVARHTAVIDWVMDRSPVFPLRFGTLFSTMAAVGATMRRHHQTIANTLDRVEHKAEWAVKAWLDRPQAVRAQVAVAMAGVPGLDNMAAGARYLRERQIQACAAREVGLWVAQCLQLAAQRLGLSAADLRCRPAGTATEDELVANWAFLVDVDKAAAFGAAAEAINHAFAPQGLRFECSGPWPPYSFCAPFGGGAAWSG